ncbi:MAG: gamma-glutamyltransferase [Bdellovibrionaceae bacterium]|nr:gamma-glutamyltransferase [Pseudobdellovibrionaceae bacterium]
MKYNTHTLFFTKVLKPLSLKNLWLSFVLCTLIAPSTSWSMPFEGQDMLIAAPSPIAVETGKEIHKLGGNVFDVAVAVALSLSVTSPYFASLGGGGFALVKKEGEAVKALDFRETAPAKTHENYYSSLAEGSSWNGGAAVGVPGIPAGLFEIHKTYGKLKWEQLFTRPLQQAIQGFPVSGEWYNYTLSQKDRFNAKGKQVFLKKNGTPYVPGETIKQPDLYHALKLFRDKKLEGFYSGAVAADIAQTVQKEGGVLSVEDLKNYKVKWREPMQTKFQGHDIYLMPPPSSGGVVIKTALALVEKLDLKKYGYMSADEYHMLAEVMSKSFRGRALLGDPDYTPLPLDKLLSEDYINELAKNIKPKYSKKMKPLDESFLGPESTETTHFVVMNKKGEAVSMTITLNGNYGSGVSSNKYGIALNNEMDDFQAIPGQANIYGLLHSKTNYVHAGKRPLSSMSPTLVLKDNSTVMALGAPGGPRIINGVFQTLYRVLVNELDVEKAIMTPRLHHQFEPNILFYEQQNFTPETLRLLKMRKHTLKATRGVAKVSAVRINKKGFLEAYSDFRGEGAVGGY